VLRAGADGYVEKGRAAREVVEAIRTVARGGKHVSPEVAAQLIEHKTGAPHDSLTDKELAVLQALGRGETPSEIAIAMGLSASTVSTHIARMRTKLGARSLGDLIRYALKNALVE
jgi:DNA-binding NarL/FixJ family response regulator